MQFRAVTLAALLLLGDPIRLWTQTPASIEYQVKAAFLPNFVKFIEWPRDAFPSDNAPINLCIVGHDPFGSALDEIIRGKAVNNRELVARRNSEVRDLKTCQLVFVSSAEDKHLSEILKNLNGSSALVVGESEDFAGRGGGIQFYLEGNKVRFYINVDALQRARLNASSKLLALAKIVHDGRQKGG